MKKALVILLILAVAGGVFAQDVSFSLGGEARVGTEINLIPDDPTIGLATDGDWGDSDYYGKGSINLTADDFTVGFGYKAAGGGGVIDFSAEYSGENYAFKGSMDLTTGALGIGNIFSDLTPGSVWGYWLFLDQALLVEVVAAGGRDETHWNVSDLVVPNWDNFDDQGTAGIKFNYSGIENIDFGIAFAGAGLNMFDGSDFVQDFFLESELGFKYDDETLGIAANLKLYGENSHPNDEALGFGVGFYYQLNDQMKVQADVLADNLGAFSDYGNFSAGAKFTYADDPMEIGFAVKARDVTQDWADLYFNPYIVYKINPDYLWAKLNLEFTAGIGDAVKDDVMRLDVTPQLVLNTKGDGATDDPGTGIMFKWQLGFDFSSNAGDTLDTNLITFGFRWAL